MHDQQKTNRSVLAAVWPMVAAGLALRLAVMPFLYSEWLDPNGAWAFGRVARSIVSGNGFGNVFAQTGATALLPPVYAYLLTGIFRLLGVYTPASIMTALGLNGLFSALTCIPVFLIARQGFGNRVAQWAAWGWAFSPYGIYYGADWAWSTCLVTLELTLLFLLAMRLETSTRTRDWLCLRIARGICRAHRTGCPVGPAAARPVDPLPALSPEPFMEGSHGCRRAGGSGRDGTLDPPQL